MLDRDLEIKFKYFSEKLLLSRNLRYFRGSRFSQCVVAYCQQLSIDCNKHIVFMLTVITNSVQCL